MHFSYEVFQGGFLDVDITVKSLKKGKVQETVFEKSRTTNGKTSWEVLDDLEYELWSAQEFTLFSRLCCIRALALLMIVVLYVPCSFSNQISTLAHKKLFFAIHKDEDVHKALADSKSVDPLNGLATDLEEKVQQAKDQLQYMAIRENRHQESAWNIFAVLLNTEKRIFVCVCMQRITIPMLE